ncbi:hypothetical protein PCO31110_03871 [Pandoraea communis]|uniref:Bacterial membrane protein YfhO n=1 Tax=Pandoraea communis TaxID=2508297 RepID=A0A5E4XDU2_9BURK|nr:YfhO family protein [Pandoraea communis]VVE34591.1 hypothetical protein PCO31110_03871 [Pandoraea communis]
MEMKISKYQSSCNWKSCNSSGYKNIAIAIFFLLLHFSFFYENLFGKSYTGWDTHDWSFVNFTYFSDALRSGSVPLWTHFIQSGNFFPSFNNVGLYTPFQLIFIVLAWVINPLQSYEFMIQAAMLVGVLGAYSLFRAQGAGRMVALFGAAAFDLTVQLPITGQMVFVFSFSSLPWLLLVCLNIIRGNSRRPYVVVCQAAFFVLYIASGYLWLNVVNLIIAFLFSGGMYLSRMRAASIEQRMVLRRVALTLGLFFLVIGVLYAGLILPGIINLSSYYGKFYGDFVSPDPRLRSLLPAENFSYNSIFHAVAAAIDPRIAANDPIWSADMRAAWPYGAGWVLWIVVLATPWKKKVFSSQSFWLILLFVALLYSTGNRYGINKIIEHIPVLKANRWWFAGGYYCSIALCMLAVLKLNALSSSITLRQATSRICLVLVPVAFIFIALDTPIEQYHVVAEIALLFWLLNVVSDRLLRNVLLMSLVCVSAFSFHEIPKSMPNYKYSKIPDLSGYFEKMGRRKVNVEITENFRKLSTAHDYVFDDEDWLLNKVPFAHGYNHLSNPIYWYVKNDAFLARIAFLAQGERVDKILSRRDFSSDNAYAEALARQISDSPLHPIVGPENYQGAAYADAVSGRIDRISIFPNSAKITVVTSSPALLVFNNVSYAGWRAYLDGKPAELISANLIFQGVRIPEGGTHTVEFVFRPYFTIFMLASPYFVLFLCALFFLRRRVLDVRLSRVGVGA